MTRFTRWLVENGTGSGCSGKTTSSTPKSPRTSRRTCEATARTSIRRKSRSRLLSPTRNSSARSHRQHGRGHPLPQRDVRAQALQTHRLAGLLAKIRLPDDGHGACRVPPVRRLSGRRPADLQFRSWRAITSACSKRWRSVTQPTSGAWLSSSPSCLGCSCRPAGRSCLSLSRWPEHHESPSWRPATIASIRMSLWATGTSSSSMVAPGRTRLTNHCAR